MDKTIDQVGSNDSLQEGSGIAAVERDTGIGKDTLRVWERRYGFPQPLRDPLGERVYPAEQVARLRLIKRLMDQGGRPGKLLAAPVDELQRLVALPDADVATTATSAAADDLVRHLRTGNAELVRQDLGQRLAREGLQRFVCSSVPELNRCIGEAWAAGRIEIFEEHLYTELMQMQLRAAIHALPRADRPPAVLLTTVSGEEHLLGLLMAEALLTAEGARCVSIGAQTPVADIALAARSVEAQVVALSFSIAYPWRKARDALLGLRRRLDAGVEVWVGGGNLHRQRKHLDGIRTFASLDEIPEAVTAWRARRAAAQDA